MKKHIGFFTLALTLTVVTAFSNPPKSSVEVVRSKHKNLFVFTVSKSLRSAEVNVRATNGDVVATQKLEKRKMIIDFCDVKSGAYTIVVKKGNQTNEFQYERR